MCQCCWRAHARKGIQQRCASTKKPCSAKKEFAMTTTRQNAPAFVPAEQEIRFWMRAPAVTITSDAPLSEALALMREHDIRRLPATLDTAELRGIITQGDIRGADILRVAGYDPIDIADALRQVKVDEVMSQDPLTVT